MNRLRAQLPVPQKPAAPPIPESREDLRVHVGTGDSFRVLQEAGAKATTQFRNSREQARREMLAQLNQPDAQRIQDGRRIWGEFAAVKRPRGKGAAFVVKGE